MLAWISLTIAALIGLFFAVETEGLAFGMSIPFAIAVPVVGALASLYILAFRSQSTDERPWWRWILRITAVVAVVAAMLPLARQLGFLSLRHGTSDITRQSVGSERSGFDGPGTEKSGPVSVRLRRASDGRFTTRAIIDGAPLDVVIDTGATNVMLRSSDAQSAGIDVDRLTFDTAIATANGTTYAAPARIRVLQIGLLAVNDIDVLVAKPGSLNDNLLGMSFLRRLASYDLAGEFLTLRY